VLERPSDRTERWTFLAVLFAIFGLFAAETFRDYEPAKLSALFVLLFWFPLLAVHEIGHALAAGLVGWRVEQVVIGFGRPLWRLQVGRASVEIRRLPIEGFVSLRPRDLRSPRLKSAFIYFAGPGIELSLAAVVLVALGPETLFTRTEEVAVIAAQSFCLAVAVGAFFNLIPHTLRGPGTQSDGLGILRSFARSDEYFAQMILPEDRHR
jgi:hypothetical protein